MRWCSRRVSSPISARPKSRFSERVARAFVHITVLAIVEGSALILPAAAVAPLLAALILRVLNVAGPLAETGLTIEPTVSRQSYLLASVAGIACLLALVLPSTMAARSILEIEPSAAGAVAAI